MHHPYEKRLKHKADFRVRYKFRPFEEGGRKQLPFQGLRSDFSYATNTDSISSVYMIFPEFENSDGNIIMEDKTPVPIEGTARMWIVIPERRPFHQQILSVGTKCFFREGIGFTADCEVIEIIDLFKNPTL